MPAHFPTDAHGLARFDGTALYEHEDPRLGFHRDWNTLIYNFGRTEVRNFLVANALYWLEHFHIDALRVDAVASMLYLDYSRKPGEWIPNIHGGRENLDAIGFLRELNVRVFGDHPGATTIAEESTAWPQVSRPVHGGGLGFGYKWNMGWMHDTLEYIEREPIHRRFHHHQMTFGIHYAFSENFVLPISHDEVVHGKRSLFSKMPGDRWQKFANLRAYLAFMWTHPGKKLLFMGSEFAQEKEWDHDHSLPWHLVAEAPHRSVQSLVRDLNRLYRTPALHLHDAEFGRLRMDRRQRRRQQRLRLCTLRRSFRPGHRGGLQLHSGRARKVSGGRAPRRTLGGAPQHRRLDLRRLERREFRRGRDPIRGMAWPPGIDLAHPSAARHHRAAARRIAEW